MSEPTKKKWYVYFLCDPDTEQPFYIGKGTGDRIHHHELMLDNSSDTNTAKKEAIRKILNQGKQVLKKKVAEFSNESDAYLYEWAMINLYHEHITNIHLGAARPRTKTAPARVTSAFFVREPYLLIEEVAGKIGSTPEFIRNEIETFRLGSNRFGNEIRVSPKDFQKYLMGREKQVG